MNIPVNPRSVQAQFANLTSEKEALRNVTEAADRDRVREEGATRSARSNQMILSGQIQRATAALGSSTKKLQLLRDEDARLRRRHEEDRANTVKLADELDRMKKDEAELKARFVKEMDGYNDELSHAINHFEERRFVRYVSAASVEGAVLPRLASLVEASNSEDPNDPSSEQNSWKVLSDRATEALGTLRESTTEYNARVAAKAELEGQIRTLRTKMMQRRSFSELDCDNLEKTWEQDWQSEGMDEREVPRCNGPDATGKAAVQNTANMALFYGGMENANEGMDIEDVENLAAADAQPT